MAAADLDPRSRLIGRESELDLIRRSLVSRHVRLLTITGLTGVGKSHLAMVAAGDLAPSFSGGSHVVPLGHLRDPDLVLAAIGRALGAAEHADPDVFDAVCAKIGDAPTLLMLDNLAHLPEASAELHRLLERRANLKILATSRSPLRLPDELVVPLSPLTAPDLSRPATASELGANAAVALFVQRARDIDPAFTLSDANASDVAEICAHLDGLPLAIELAATRMRILSPAALKERLSDALAILTSTDPHLARDHRSLRAAIASTVELLSPPSRTLFRRLAVFADRCDTPAVEAVCAEGRATGTHACDVLDALAELLEDGLLHRTVVADEPRFTMPETICEFALEELEAAGEADRIRHRYASYYMTMAEEAAPSLIGARQQAWFERLATELANIRSGMRWSLANDPELALRTAAALWRFWYAKGQLREGAYWLDRALSVTSDDRSVHRVRALNGYGVLIWASGEPERALRLQQESLSLAQELGDAWGSAVARADIAIVEFEINGDAASLIRKTEQALATFRELGDRHLEAIALNTLGDVALIQGDLTAAIQRFREAVSIASELGDATSHALSLCNLAQAERRQGALERAEQHHLEALALSERIGAQEDVLYNLAGLAGLAAERHDFERAAELLGATTRLSDATGIALQPAEQEQFDRDVARVRQATANGAFAAAWDRGRSRPPDDFVAFAVSALPAVERPTAYGLSQRETEVLGLLANGCSDREIADALFISSDTASTHVRNIRRKLGVHTRAAATAFAIRHNLI